MMGKRRSRGRRAWPGFTILEILVVVSIIGTLVAITIPSMAKARIAAKAAVVLGDVHVIQTGIAAYGGEKAMGCRALQTQGQTAFSDCHPLRTDLEPHLPRGFMRPLSTDPTATQYETGVRETQGIRLEYRFYWGGGLGEHIAPGVHFRADSLEGVMILRALRPLLEEIGTISIYTDHTDTVGPNPEYMMDRAHLASAERQLQQVISRGGSPNEQQRLQATIDAIKQHMAVTPSTVPRKPNGFLVFGFK
jgi:prepilin-type N-terminal cleavage/methylation domain-containing protein